MSDTPETDEHIWIYVEHDNRKLVDAEFAKTLERERDAYADALRSIHLITICGEDMWSDLEEILAIAHNALNNHE